MTVERVSSTTWDRFGTTQDGTRCWLAHHMCMVDAKTFIVAESDNHFRASFLFKVELA